MSFLNIQWTRYITDKVIILYLCCCCCCCCYWRCIRNERFKTSVLTFINLKYSRTYLKTFSLCCFFFFSCRNFLKNQYVWLLHRIISKLLYPSLNMPCSRSKQYSLYRSPSYTYNCILYLLKQNSVRHCLKVENNVERFLYVLTFKQQ
jgi:hypothetical protein